MQCRTPATMPKKFQLSNIHTYIHMYSKSASAIHYQETNREPTATMSEISNIITEANELAEFCASESLSEEGLLEIFERHKLIERHGLPPTRDNNNPHVNNYDFFIAAKSYSGNN
eukprot:scaffold5084_cov109-Skeletonema_marinoi.AAC.5